MNALLDAFHKDQALGEIEALLPEKHESVVSRLEALLEEAPGNARALRLLARCHLLAGRVTEARQVLEPLLADSPEDVAAMLLMAKASETSGDLGDAVKFRQQVSNLRPEIVENWQRLSDLLQKQRDLEGSKNALRQYELIKSFNDRLRAAEQAFSKGDFASADTICRQLLKLVPNEVRTLRLLARLASRFGYFEFATSTLARCVETRPADVTLGLDYANALMRNRMFREALEQSERLAKLAPENLAVYRVMAESMYHLGRYEQAIEIYRALSSVPEKRAVSLVQVGKSLRTLGDAEGAIASYKQALDAEPELGQAWWELADLKTYRFSDAEVDTMQQSLESGDTGQLDKVMIGFALGKALEDAGQYEQSFEYYDSANQAYSKLRPFQSTNQNELAKAVFTPAYFEERSGYGNPTDAPVFIVGLPRSGTTLIEQILASHSGVDSTGELDEIVSIARTVNDPGGPAERQYPQSMNALSSEQVSSLAERYLKLAKVYRGDAPRFTDKAPGNFQHIGLIKTLFPNARIVDVRRSPLASGWSLFKQFFGDSFLFSYDLETIGQYYSDYADLMDHWHTVLPGQILTINYEDLVADLPETVQTLLDFCQLDFEASCLEFYLNDRAVATPSAGQVRQPIYTHALEQWKNYEAFLAPLKSALGPATDLDARLQLAERHQQAGDFREAERVFRRAISENPDSAPARYLLGNMLKAEGKLREAETCYRQVLVRQPTYAQAHFTLSGIHRYEDPADPHLKSMLEEYENPGLDTQSRTQLAFALAKAFEDLGDYAGAFRHLETGNRLRASTFDYDIASDQALIDSIIQAFDKEAIADLRTSTTGSDRPIFIIGMPRSGTSLVEKILASHSEVFGAGELDTMFALGTRGFLNEKNHFLYQPLDTYAQEIFSRVGRTYLEQIATLNAEAAHVTDKMPFNVMMVGLIRIALPDAVIIHCRRDPRDTCLSIYKQNFTTGNYRFAYDLKSIAQFYNQYLRLMSHWHEAVPRSIVDISYEALTNDPETEIRQLLAACKLPFEESCLAFDKTDAVVRTASAFQVRQPMYTSSVGLWKQYEPFLGPLLDELGNA